MDGWKRHLINASTLVAVPGLVFVVGGVTLRATRIAPGIEAVHRSLYQLVTHVVFGGVILALGAHIERSDLVPEERFSVIVWCYGGFTFTFVLSVWGHLGSILDGALNVSPSSATS